MFHRALFGPLLSLLLDFKSKLFGATKVSDAHKKDSRKGFKGGKPVQELIWLNVISLAVLHFSILYGIYVYWREGSLALFIWSFVHLILGGFGVTGGAHRLWAHKSYKAKLPFKLFALYCFTSSGQNSVYDWVRDHRVHHRYSETDADPHNAKRGFFFSHVGWLMMTKHPEVYDKGKNIDMSDIEKDPLLAFQRKYFVILKLLFAFLLPTAGPPFLWGESWKVSFFAICVIRYAALLNFTWLVNSAAHIWGSHPFDKRISPTQNLSVAILALGEGWHNYHHVFPWDYKAAELGPYSTNFTTMIIDFAARLGLVYDLKQPPKELIEKIAKKYGDGTWRDHEYSEQERKR